MIPLLATRTISLLPRWSELTETDRTVGLKSRKIRRPKLEKTSVELNDLIRHLIRPVFVLQYLWFMTMDLRNQTYNAQFQSYLVS